MEKLTTEQITILEKGIANGKKFQTLLRALASIFLVLLAVNLFLRWEFPATFFIGSFAGFMVVITVIQYFMYRKIVRDLANGVSTTIVGVIAKKEVKQGPNSYNDSYTKESLEEIALYMENKEKGIEKDHGVEEWNLRRAASSSFHIILVDGSIHSVNIREYIDLNIHDKVQITLTPLSRTFLSVSKV
jgi:hypothetical protein